MGTTATTSSNRPAAGSSASDATAIDRSIVAEGLIKDFGDLRAVDGVDLNVSSGQIFGFLGPNGAGKSTVVKMLTTILRPRPDAPGSPASTSAPSRARCGARSALPCRKSALTR